MHELFPFASLEELLCSEFGFGLGDKITPVQQALCYVLEHKEIPDSLWDLPEVNETFHGIRPDKSLNEMEILCGVRCGKTLFSAGCAVWAAFSIDTTSAMGIHLRKGETPRVSVVSATTDNAEETLKYIVGAFTESPFLSQLLAKPITGDSVVVRHPNGHNVEIKVSAMSSKGVNLVSRWCATVIFDEAPRMASEDEGIINLEEQVKAVRMRMLKGSWILYVGSPVGAKGFVYDIYDANKGKDTQKCIIFQAYSYRMNPTYWLQIEDNGKTRCENLELLDSDTYKCDVLAQFRDPETQFFSNVVIDNCIRKGPLAIPPEQGKRYMAVMDPAATTNAWTFCIAESPDNRKFRVVYHCQFLGSKSEPLSPKSVISQLVPICESYGVETIVSDQYMATAIRDIAADLGIGISDIPVTKLNKNKNYLSLLARMEAQDVELPNDPALRRDFMNVKKRYSKGEIQIIPVETSDGRHCDYCAMLALLIGGYLDAYGLDAKKEEQKPDYERDPYELEIEFNEFDYMEDDLPINAESLEEYV